MSSSQPVTLSPTWFERAVLTSWRPYAWISLAILLVYGRTFFFQDYTFMDDYHMIVESHHLLTDPQHFLKAFAEDVFHKKQGGMYYRPLLTVSLMIDTFLGGTDVRVYHVSNVLYHLIACVSLLVFLREVGLSKHFAFWSTLVFALHPAATQTVVWIPGRNESLVAIFILLSFIALVRFSATQRLRWCATYLLFFALALLTKENALMLVPLSLLFLLLRFLGGQKLQLLFYALVVVGWVFIVLYWHYAREAAMILGISDFSSAGATVARNAWTLFPFFGTIVLPADLFTVAVAEDLSIVPGLLGLAVLVFLFFSSREKHWSLFILGICWFIMFFLPTFYRHPAALYPQRFFEHRIYVSFVGVILMAASVSSASYWTRLLPLFKPGLLVLCLVLGGLSFRHSGAFENAMAFSEQAARTSPRSMFYQLEITMMELPESFRALVDFSKSTVTPSEYYSRLKEVEVRIQLSRAQDQSDMDAKLGAAAVYFAMGKLKSAEAELKQVVAVRPGHITAHYNLGVLYYHGHEENLSEHHWLKTLELNPSHAEGSRNLCYLYYLRQDFATALRYARQAGNLGATIPEELLAELQQLVD